ncbi:MAG: biotin/lipoyl-binding protein [Planctomycetota bacterium]
MSGMPDISTVEISRTCVRLREDLVFVPQQYHDGVFYHLEVKSSSEFFRIGYPESVFISLLDGETSFSEALAVTSQVLKDQSLTQTQATAIYSWLLEHKLATFVDEDTAASGASTSIGRTGRRKSFLSGLNPLWFKVPFGRPQALLKAIQPALGWIFSAAAAGPAILLLIVAGFTLVAQWTQFTSASASIIAHDNWLWLFLVWVALKLLHELGHGLVCLRYDGTVRETGVIFAVFAPLAYVDASSSWAFRSRWHRIHTALAGVYVELIIASIAMLLWASTSSLTLRHVLQNIIVMASISTVLFNLNPLMKFDGYYILSDLLNIPNLSSQATDVLKSFVQRVFLGTGGSIPVVTGSRRWILLTYGLASSVWRVTVLASLLLAASVLLHGAGVALAAAGGLLWIGRPLWKFMKECRSLWLQHPERFFRASVLGTSVVAALLVLTLGVPAPVMTTAPGVVEFIEGQTVRAETEGFVESVHVASGQFVNAGDLLVLLRNDDVQTRLIDLQQKVAQEESRLQSALHQHDVSAINIAQGNLDSFRKQLRECQKQADGLQLRAGRAGRIVGRELSNLAGTYAKAGMELLTIGLDDAKEVRLSVGQRDLPVATGLIGKPLKVRVGTSSPVIGTLTRINPKGSRSIPHDSLIAPNGGALTVVESRRRTEDGDRLELAEHRFTAVVTLPAAEASRFLCGQRGTASLGLPKASLGKYLWTACEDWFRSRLELLGRGEG